MTMDQYIIDNMPDDAATADIVISDHGPDGSYEAAIAYDGDSYVITVGVAGEAEHKIVAAFDPTLDLLQVFSIIGLLNNGTVTALSDDLVAKLTDKYGPITTEDPAQA